MQTKKRSRFPCLIDTLINLCIVRFFLCSLINNIVRGGGYIQLLRLNNNENSIVYSLPIPGSDMMVGCCWYSVCRLSPILTDKI